MNAIPKKLTHDGSVFLVILKNTIDFYTQLIGAEINSQV
ncbi:hypothetical protein QE429_001104 [Bacillus sp. SORGH_AS 510]|nr:hypothetical protein [Bacillus sp. SORGH_AS_0510]